MYECGFTSFEGIKGRKDKDDFISLIFIKKEYFYYKLEKFNCKLGEARQRESKLLLFPTPLLLFFLIIIIN